MEYRDVSVVIIDFEGSEYPTTSDAAISASGLLKLNQVGSGRIRLSAEEPIIEHATPGNIVSVELVPVDPLGRYLPIAYFYIKDVVQVDTAQGKFVDISGADAAQGLTFRKVGYNTFDTDTGDPLAEIMAYVASFYYEVTGTETVPDGDILLESTNQTVFEMLRQIRAQTGESFACVPQIKKVYWYRDDEDSGIILANDGASTHDPILEIKRNLNGANPITRVSAVGAGMGENRLSFSTVELTSADEAALEAEFPGISWSDSSAYLKKGDYELDGYPINEHELNFSFIMPFDETDESIYQAVLYLHKTAARWFADQSISRTSYTVKTITEKIGGSGFRSYVVPGMTVHLTYTNNQYSVDDDLYIHSVSHVYEKGLRMTTLTLSSSITDWVTGEEKLAEKITSLDTSLRTSSAVPSGTQPSTVQHHSLLGLADDDHPQYLREDGGRPLVGDLVVGDGYTIDGIDVSAHAVDADAHHDPATAGDGLDLSGQQLAVDSTVVRTSRTVTAGDGLTGGGALASNLSLNVVAGDGLSVAADSVSLATPGTLSLSSSNAAAGSHTHSITSSDNPGAAASLLKTDATGAVTLDHIHVTNSVNAGSGIFSGAVDVGSDFTVGTNVLQVDESGQRVGINRAADAQFALDVSGNIRSDGYIVGQHAIQLPDAKMIVHFDGPEPYETDFNGSALGHMGQVPTITGPEVYRPGKFGKALQVAEATTNLITNPVFPNTAGWGTLGTNVLSASSEQFLFEDQSMKAVYKDFAHLAYFPMPSITAVTHVASAYLFIPSTYSGTSLVIYFSNYIGSVSVYGYADMSIRDEWQYVFATVTPDAGDLTGQFYIREGGTLPDVDDYIYIDGVQVEAKAYPTPLCYGDLPGHTWSGTAHASSSSRGANRVTYDNISMQSGSVGMWHYFKADKQAVNYPRLFTLFNGSEYILLLVDTNSTSTTNIYASHTVGGGTVQTNISSGNIRGWHHIVVTWESGSFKLYIDGALFDTRTYPATDLAGSLDIGSAYGANHVNQPIDDLIITDYAMDADLIRAIYESNAPVFAESSIWSFKLPNNLVWADEEGLWMKTAAGSAAFGMVGVDGKSWGGLSLDAGDLLVGNSSTNYMEFDVSAGLLELSGKLLVQGDSELVGAVSLGTSGGIYQGTGTFASPTTGLKMWNDSGVGRIAGYNTGTLQAGFGSDGKLTAGGGVVKLDSDGISLTWGSSSDLESQIKWKNGSGTVTSKIIGISTGDLLVNSSTSLTLQASTSTLILNATKAFLAAPLETTGSIRTYTELYLGASGDYRLRRNGTHVEWYNGSSWVQLD